MTLGWCVRVSVFDDLVVSISERELSGRDLTAADQDLIRDCARHLLSFAGSRPDEVFAVDPTAEGRERGLRASQDRPSVAVVVPPQEDAARWQPIETAQPERGQACLVWRKFPGDIRQTVYQCPHTWEGLYGWEPTHWMPLPAPPVSA